MGLNLFGKRVLLMGGSRGIGAATVRMSPIPRLEPTRPMSSWCRENND